MRKFSIAAVAASAAVLTALAGTAQAASTTHVLTVGKAHGTAVKTGASLRTGLIKGTQIVFALKAESLTCKVSNLVAVDGTNPKAKGTAVEVLKSQSFAKCTIHDKAIPGLKVKGLKALNLPYVVSVSDKKGDPVKVTGHLPSKPLVFSVTAALGTITVTCEYQAKVLNGHASNKANEISIVNQKFKRIGGNTLCPASAGATAFFGPVRDFSVKGHPKVFVN